MKFFSLSYSIGTQIFDFICIFNIFGIVSWPTKLKISSNWPFAVLLIPDSLP